MKKSKSKQIICSKSKVFKYFKEQLKEEKKNTNCIGHYTMKKLDSFFQRALISEDELLTLKPR